VPQRTFSIIKPDAVRNGDAAAMLSVIEEAGFKLVAIKKISISKAQAEDFMSSGPIFPLVLEKENAIADFRTLMGATNPANAAESTLRKLFASSIEENAVHGSDGEDTAAFEIGYFFAGYELA
jgi:nucleoside-diphosphate kinase